MAGVKALSERKTHFPIHLLIKLNNEIEAYLTTVEGIDKFHVAGSFRRVKEMSKDLDYIISSTET